MTTTQQEQSSGGTALLHALQGIVGSEGVLSRHEELLVYECDGYVVEKKVPDVVVFPTTSQQVADVVHVCNEHEVPFVPRGAGTSLAGGTLPVGGGVMICTTRMRKILDVQLRDRYAAAVEVDPDRLRRALPDELIETENPTPNK